MYIYKLYTICKMCGMPLLSDEVCDTSGINNKLAFRCSRCNKEITLGEAKLTCTIMVLEEEKDK